MTDRSVDDFVALLTVGSGDPVNRTIRQGVDRTRWLVWARSTPIGSAPLFHLDRDRPAPNPTRTGT